MHLHTYIKNLMDKAAEGVPHHPLQCGMFPAQTLMGHLPGSNLTIPENLLKESEDDQRTTERAEVL